MNEHETREQDFREAVLTGLADLKTKMNILVGADGTNGRFGTLEARVGRLEHSESRRNGFIAAWTVVVGAGAWLLERFAHVGGH